DCGYRHRAAALHVEARRRSCRVDANYPIGCIKIEQMIESRRHQSDVEYDIFPGTNLCEIDTERLASSTRRQALNVESLTPLPPELQDALTGSYRWAECCRCIGQERYRDCRTTRIGTLRVECLAVGGRCHSKERHAARAGRQRRDSRVRCRP